MAMCSKIDVCSSEARNWSDYQINYAFVFEHTQILHEMSVKQ